MTHTVRQGDKCLDIITKHQPQPVSVGEDIERIAKKLAWSLAKSYNAAMSGGYKADCETFIEAIRAIQKQTLTAIQKGTGHDE